MNIIIAADFSSSDEILDFCFPLDPTKFHIKIGLEAFISCGPDLVKELVDENYSVLLDLKIHDIPNTVYRSVKRICDLNVWGLTIHTQNSSKGMKAASDAVLDGRYKPLVFGVTVLTSMENEDLKEIGISDSFNVSSYVKHLAEIGWYTPSYLNGFVCSSKEASIIKSINPNIIVVSPGIRFNVENGDQKRVSTIDEAKRNGVDYAVVGREITLSEDPVATANMMYEMALDL